MSVIPSKEKLASMPVLLVYRHLLKAMPYYPSAKRYELIIAMKEEFRDNKNLTDEKKIEIERKKAYMGLAHALIYKDKMDKLKTEYRVPDTMVKEDLNPKGKNFVYF
mmetsp:Transcript_5607/g.6051  ORF Transcript_5607/g.6051 Transcript_5607/m.6051 type:complete len:107 (-) Transcript_5607:20-340(-)